jgi:Uma2 family endonuclease
MSLTVKDLEKLHSLLSEQHLDYQMELVDGKIIVMGPSDYLSEEVIAQLVTLLRNWVTPRRLGRVTGSSAGFKLPNPTNDLRAPDVSFVRAERLRRSPRNFADLVPDLTVEVKSKSDRIKPLEEKIQQFLALGTEIGMLIDPDKETVTIYYRDDRQPVVLGNGDTITIPDLLLGWSAPVSDLWPPVFE